MYTSDDLAGLIIQGTRHQLEAAPAGLPHPHYSLFTRFALIQHAMVAVHGAATALRRIPVACGLCAQYEAFLGDAQAVSDAYTAAIKDENNRVIYKEA